jgi:hypothetical protein
MTELAQENRRDGFSKKNRNDISQEGLQQAELEAVRHAQGFDDRGLREIDRTLVE